MTFCNSIFNKDQWDRMIWPRTGLQTIVRLWNFSKNICGIHSDGDVLFQPSVYLLIT